jgi:hypothetical protein
MVMAAVLEALVQLCSLGIMQQRPALQSQVAIAHIVMSTQQQMFGHKGDLLVPLHLTVPALLHQVSPGPVTRTRLSSARSLCPVGYIQHCGCHGYVAAVKAEKQVLCLCTGMVDAVPTQLRL